MIIPDINLLLYAYDSTSPFHAQASAWWQTCLSGAVLHTADADFVRFQNLRWLNPITGIGSRSLRRGQ